MIELSQDKYADGKPCHAEYLEGAEAFMTFGKGAESDCPYYQPHDAAKRDAWMAGCKDEQIWALDSTGR